MKFYHIILTLLIGIGIGILIMAYWASNESGIEDSQLGRLKNELGWRDLKEKKIINRVNNLAKDSSKQAKEIVRLRIVDNQSETKYKEAKRAIPVTHKDTIVFLMRDTLLCDSALLRSKELVAGLTIEIMTDESIIKGLGELTDSLQVDKKQLKESDSLHLRTEKQLRKSARKKFFRGIGVGGVIGVILGLLL